MKKKTYNSPSLSQEEVVLEMGIAVSEGKVELIMPEEWQEGNTGWW